MAWAAISSEMSCRQETTFLKDGRSAGFIRQQRSTSLHNGRAHIGQTSQTGGAHIGRELRGRGVLAQSFWDVAVVWEPGRVPLRNELGHFVVLRIGEGHLFGQQLEEQVAETVHVSLPAVGLPVRHLWRPGVVEIGARLCSPPLTRKGAEEECAHL